MNINIINYNKIMNGFLYLELLKKNIKNLILWLFILIIIFIIMILNNVNKK